MNREAVEIAGRGSMHPARKRRIWERVAGKCWMCGLAVPETGEGVRYDHKLPLDLGGSDDDANIYPLHTDPCDKLKTKADRARIDKARRQGKMKEPKAPSRLKSRGFEKPREKRPWGKRGWGRGQTPDRAMGDE